MDTTSPSPVLPSNATLVLTRVYRRVLKHDIAQHPRHSEARRKLGLDGVDSRDYSKADIVALAAELGLGLPEPVSTAVDAIPAPRKLPAPAAVFTKAPADESVPAAVKSTLSTEKLETGTPSAGTGGMEAEIDAIVAPVTPFIAAPILGDVRARVEKALQRRACAAPRSAGRSARPQAAEAGRRTARELFGFGKPYDRYKAAVWSGSNIPVDPGYIHTPELTFTAMYAIDKGYPVLIGGPRGTGKSTLVEQIAARLGRPFRSIVLRRDSEPAMLIGQRLPAPDGSPGFVFHDGALTQALRIPGCVIALEEISFGGDAILELLQGILSSGRLIIEETGEEVCVDRISFAATDNTTGLGDSSGLYRGTQALNIALLDRFHSVIEVPAPDAKTVVRILASRVPDLAPAIAEHLATLHARSQTMLEKGDLSMSVSIRQLIAYSQAVADGVPAGPAWRASVLAKLPETEAQALHAHALQALPTPPEMAKLQADHAVGTQS
jgi:cobaltochelatase CobS